MTFSTIDLGTNTILMVTVKVDTDGAITVLDDRQEVARLGKGVDASMNIQPDAFDRVADFLQYYRTTARSLGSERIVAFGTSALRDARNQNEFVAAMKERTGIAFQIISGEEEAELTYEGALFGLGLKQDRIAVLDIGGGSTELALGELTTKEERHLTQHISVDIGAVRITERYFQQQPPTQQALSEARMFAREQLSEMFSLPPETVAAGVAGTVTTLGAVSYGLQNGGAEELNGKTLSGDAIAQLTRKLSGMTLSEIISVPQIPTGRADVILGGSIILDEFMKHFGLEEIVVSTRGVRYGMMLKEAAAFTTAELHPA